MCSSVGDMENNNTPRKATLYYGRFFIPIIVLEDNGNSLITLLDMERLEASRDTDDMKAAARNAYLDACTGSPGWGEKVPEFRSGETSLGLVKEDSNYSIEYLEPDEAQDVPVDSTGIDDVPPQIDMHGELNQHLTILARSGYKVKSFDVNIQEGGEAHLCATFTKEVDN